MRLYRDTATIQQDSAADGVAVPDFSGSPLIEDLPCKITSIGGNETYRGRSLEPHIKYVVECQYIQSVSPTMRLYVQSGVWTGRYLNIEYTAVLEGGGRARKLELYCSETVSV
jgi:hypothetical protein